MLQSIKSSKIQSILNIEIDGLIDKRRYEMDETGYTRVLTSDQSKDLQIDSLKTAGCQTLRTLDICSGAPYVLVGYLTTCLIRITRFRINNK